VIGSANRSNCARADAGEIPLFEFVDAARLNEGGECSDCDEAEKVDDRDSGGSAMVDSSSDELVDPVDAQSVCEL
jgi:hypothetical protein